MLKKVLTNAVLPILASFIIGAILISAIGAAPGDVLGVKDNLLWVDFLQVLLLLKCKV